MVFLFVCDMLLPWSELNGRHLATSQCSKGEERNHQRLVGGRLCYSKDRAFQDHGKPLETVTLFKYLGRVMMAGDDDWPSVVGNLIKARKSWAWMTRILGREGSEPRIYGFFFQGGSSGSVAFQVRDVGPDPPHKTGPGKFSAQGRAADHREAYKEGGGLGVSTTCVSYGGD